MEPDVGEENGEGVAEACLVRSPGTRAKARVKRKRSANQLPGPDGNFIKQEEKVSITDFETLH